MPGTSVILGCIWQQVSSHIPAGRSEAGGNEWAKIGSAGMGVSARQGQFAGIGGGAWISLN